MATWERTYRYVRGPSDGVTPRAKRDASAYHRSLTWLYDSLR
ncbi:hypothetical protein SAMN02927923_04312 [Microvirga guangxiensis]|uniref:Uncharacterized protein n=1 Tax=Microvirga guangxiensis TaxID=549386 RepID=A0A1G5LI95_9HYPH|nr:hypothetical protein SAMN02927923_04312 [Microvirga guangxiensis]